MKESTMNGPSKLGKVAHNLGMSAWFGGTLFGQVALNPTARTPPDQRARGRRPRAGRAAGPRAPAGVRAAWSPLGAGHAVELERFGRLAAAAEKGARVGEL